MGSPKLLVASLVTLFSFSSINAGPCSPQSPEEISTTSLDSATATSTSVEGTTTPFLESDTTIATTIITTSTSKTSTTSEASALCTLPTRFEETIQAPSQFNLAFETCDGSYGENYRLVGSGGNGEWVWTALNMMADTVSLNSDGYVLYSGGVLISVQPPDEDHQWVSYVFPTDGSKDDWSRIKCHASTPDNGTTKWLRCTGTEDTSVHFQLCESGYSGSRVYLVPKVKVECKEFNFRIIEIVEE
ncbi:hypothetical protein QQZ08_010557 [Neonectria magnoliae]|uniref:C-type lectin domain-containing protein n=1 Tax=Neonectria magnoliae TaxID=2732573 RepID=A0ABR1HG25_9HYPO